MRYQIAALLGVFIQLSLRPSDAEPTSNGTLRLVGGSSDLEGRVEVYHDERWGTICSDKFDDDNAKVLCHMLGFDRDGAKAYTNASFGEGTGMIWLDNLSCIGTEETVESCEHNVWGHHDCGHSGDAGIKCLPKRNDVELEGNVSVILNCTLLSTPTNGRFSPETCQSEAVISGSVCRLVCDPGYQANMSSDSFNCLVTGKWDSNVLSACIDVDECLTKNGSCQYTCMNTEGSYTCSCESGYQLNHDLHTCTDVDECLTENGGCQHTCLNTEGSYTCSCKSGYLLKRDHQTCRDVDECSTKNGGCQHTCLNTEGSYTCSCESGYLLKRDHRTCRDIDECSTENGGCRHTCINTEGSFTCSCDSGYQLNQDHHTCTDIDECSDDGGGCQHMCHNTEGSHTCSCQPGYRLREDNRSCVDIDECSAEKSGCQHTCINTKGSFTCSCDSGYQLNQDNHTCTESQVRVHTAVYFALALGLAFITTVLIVYISVRCFNKQEPEEKKRNKSKTGFAAQDIPDIVVCQPEEQASVNKVDTLRLNVTDSVIETSDVLGSFSATQASFLSETEGDNQRADTGSCTPARPTEISQENNNSAEQPTADRKEPGSLAPVTLAESCQQNLGTAVQPAADRKEPGSLTLAGPEKICQEDHDVPRTPDREESGPLSHVALIESVHAGQDSAAQPTTVTEETGNVIGEFLNTVTKEDQMDSQSEMKNAEDLTKEDTPLLSEVQVPDITDATRTEMLDQIVNQCIQDVKLCDTLFESQTLDFGSEIRANESFTGST